MAEFVWEGNRATAVKSASPKVATARSNPRAVPQKGSDTVTVIHQKAGSTSSGISLPSMGGDGGVIITSIVVATGLTSINQLLHDKRSMRPIIGGFVVGTMLLVGAFFSTSIASALALLLLVASVLNNGIPILEKVMNAAS